MIDAAGLGRVCAALDVVMGARRDQARLLVLGRIPRTLDDPAMPTAARLEVLRKQVGDVALAGEDPAHLVRELAQLAAAAVAWIEGLVADHGADTMCADCGARKPRCEQCELCHGCHPLKRCLVL